MKIVHGDLIKMGVSGKFDVIVHGANCFCTMGAGIAKQIATHLPMAYEADKKTSYGDIHKLGKISTAEYKISLNETLTIVNAYTQFDFRGRMNVNYDAIRSCFITVSELFSGKKIGYPMIGAGLAGGDWNIIKEIIDDVLYDQDHTLVIYKP